MIILTSNLGSSLLLQAHDQKEARKQVLSLIHDSFKPEFINRLDEIIIFQSLGAEQVKKIVSIQLQQLATRLERRGHALSWDEGVVDLVFQEGFDVSFGARPVKRAIQRLVENPLSVQLLAGEFLSSGAIHLTRVGDAVVAIKAEDA